jgi:hypothetical protein
MVQYIDFDRILAKPGKHSDVAFSEPAIQVPQIDE